MKFKDLSIKKKITYLFLPLSILPIIIFAILSINLYEKSIINRSLVSMADNNILVSDRINGILSEAESGATFLTISINSLLNDNEFQGQLSDDIKLYNLISNELAYAKLIYKEIDSIAFYDIYDQIYYTDANLLNFKEEITQSSLHQALVNSTGEHVWSDISNRKFLTNAPEAKVVTLGKKVWNIQTGQTIGYLYINIVEESFTQLFNNQISDYYIYNDASKVISSFIGGDAEMLHSENHKDFLSNTDLDSDLISDYLNKFLVSKIRIEKVNWTLLSQTNLNELTQDLDNLLILMITMLILIILIEIVISFVLNDLITNPIIKLKGGIEQIAQGNFDYRFKMKTNDEIGLFSKSFNHMSEQIKSLLHQVALEEKKKREFELALIQEQIKPHFLYNTLDIILKLSQMGKSRKAQKVTILLADYYRNSLSAGADIVTVADEIKITKDYLALQKIRYSDILDYKINLSPNIVNKYIPKLTLQPLVENAIYHGLKYKSESGLIDIYDEVIDEEYFIVVSDNGVGIKEGDISRINTYLNEEEFTYKNKINQSFGIRNVNHRLKLFLGKNYGIIIHSGPQQGTKVMIKLPKDKVYD